MLLVFVVDTSPSMGRPAMGDSGISRLDLAKMAVEDFVRQWRKMRENQSRLLGRSSPEKQRLLLNLGQYMNATDQFWLLSTSSQHPEAAGAAAVHFSDNHHQQQPSDILVQAQQQRRIEAFQRELKGLKVMPSIDNTRNNENTTSEDVNYATGLNAALSAGLQLFSRYRLQQSQTENFGMGRLPNCAVVTTNGSPASSALQPASLILVSDGACLRLPPKQGGGALQLQFGSQPLREFYREPFRWDQRIFVLAVGGREGVASSQYLHPQLRALCEVTGGSHWMIRGSSSLSNSTDTLVKSISPSMPRELPIPEPLYLRISSASSHPTVTMEFSFVDGGPICCFQTFEAEEAGKRSPTMRAMLLYVSSSTMNATPTQDPTLTGPSTTSSAGSLSPPLWCIPEAFFPSKKLDSLPPRSAQPLLFFSKHPSILGSKSFEPLQLIKQLHRFDQMISTNRKLMGQQIKYLHRDVYICEWINPEGGKIVQLPLIGVRSEYFPVFVQGAARPTLSEESETYLNIGILHVPVNTATSSTETLVSRLSTLTLLPPEPQILLRLLIRAAESEYKVLKRSEISGSSIAGSTADFIQKQSASGSIVPIDEHWRSEFRAYLFRLPPYYQNSIKRALRSVLPSSVHSLLHTEDMESIATQCFSKLCLQKIRNGEQIARDSNDRLERLEQSLGRGHAVDSQLKDEKVIGIRYGQFDPRSSTESYLAAIRNMPAPWKIGAVARDVTKNSGDLHSYSPKSALETLGNLPTECLMAYYESRRRWIFGGPGGLSIRGLHVEGVKNDGGNSQMCGRKPGEGHECLLTLAGVGASTLNRTSTTKMGEYKERVLFSRSPVVGYGSNDASGVAATTAIDGSPRWSVDDDVMPLTFFDPKTGEFADSAQARVRSKLQVNFGNPYKEKRGDSLVPEKYLSQTPPRQGRLGSTVDSSRSLAQSTQNDSFDSVEEGEAIFVRKSPSRTSPKREEQEEPISPSLPKRLRSMSDEDVGSSGKRARTLSEEDIASYQLSNDQAKVVAPPQRQKQSTAAAAVPPPPPLPPPQSSQSPSLDASAQTRPRKAPLPPTRPPPPKPQTLATQLSQNLNAPMQVNPKLPPAPPPKPNPGGIKPPKPTHSVAAKVNQAGPRLMELTAKASENRPFTTAIPIPNQQSLDQELENPDVKPDIDLPSGWISVWSKSKGRWYFFDTKTSKSVWKWPP